jgi:hypothetical protein
MHSSFCLPNHQILWKRPYDEREVIDVRGER